MSAWRSLRRPSCMNQNLILTKNNYPSEEREKILTASKENSGKSKK